MSVVKVMQMLGALKGKSLFDVTQGMLGILPKPIKPDRWTLSVNGIDLGKIVLDHGMGLVLPKKSWIEFDFDPPPEGSPQKLRAEMTAGGDTIITLDGEKMTNPRFAFSPGYYRFNFFVKLSFIWDEGGKRTEYRFQGKIT